MNLIIEFKVAYSKRPVTVYLTLSAGHSVVISLFVTFYFQTKKKKNLDLVVRLESFILG